MERRSNVPCRAHRAPAAAGDGAALEEQEPVPRIKRAATLPGMHEIVSLLKAT